MKKLYFFQYCMSIFILAGSIKSQGQSNSPTDYFRSAQSGLWDVPNTWESSPDGLNNWSASAIAPTSDANTIIIRSGHSVTISNSATVDQVVIADGGLLDVATVPLSALTIHNGQGPDVVVQNGGVFKHNIAANSSLPSFAAVATLEIQSGGILEAANNNGTPGDYANTSSSISSQIIWGDGAIFNWNTTSNPTEGVTYFPASSAVPIFRFSKPVAIGGTSATVINGLLEANANVSFQGNSSKTFRNGITGTGKVGVTALNGGGFIINGATAILGGTGILELNNSGLKINSSTTLTLTSDKTINNYNSGTGSITDSGTLVLDKFIINGNSKINIDGTVKTTNINGLTGGTNTAFATASGFTVNAFGASSSVEYNGLKDQIVSPLAYSNLIISGLSTKTAAAGTDVSVSGELNIAAGNTFALSGTDDLKLNKGGTLNVNADAVFDNGGESQVSGGGPPTINIYGTFITRDAQGFTGFNTSIPGIVPNIFPGSTIEYGKEGNQIVTRRDDYKNITFSGSGIKTIPTCIPEGTVTIKDKVIADASNKTFGDISTNLTMTGGRLIVGGTGTKPDIAGIYNLTGGVIEFTNSGSTKETIRSPYTYFNIEVSGSSVFNSSGNITLADGGSFTVKPGGIYENIARRIDGTTGTQTFKLEAGATFKTGVTGGFAGNDTAALENIENLVIDPKSTVIYSRSGNQTITPLADYPTLLLKGGGTKTVASGIVTISPAADSVVIDTLVVLKVKSGAKVNFNNRQVIIHSDVAGTGIIGEITDGSSALLNATNVTVERFIPARRSFRFLSPSVTTSTSIKANWMEGAVNPNTTTRIDPNHGYGTNITGIGGTANGFDPTITNNPSLFTFNTSTQHWIPVANTNGTLPAGSAYRMMVRGDRSIDMTTANNDPAPSNTILRTTGTLFAGTFSPALSTVDKGYTFIGNPYASPVDFEEMIAYNSSLGRVTGSANNIKPEYTIWEPKLSRRGAYVTYNVVNHSTGIPNSAVNKDIQSGQAIFVQTVGNNSSPQIQFEESYKSTGITNVFRDPDQIAKLSVQLLLNLNDGLENNADGITAFFNENFSNNIGNEDSYKFTNLDENLAISNNGIFLSIEGRPAVTADDTLPLQMWQLRQQNYYLRLTGSNFSSGVTAFVKDSYLTQEIPIDLSSGSLLPFTVDTAISASFANRFTIVFKSGNVLPVTFTEVNAYEEDKGVHVNWTARTEINIDRYEIEKSINGQQFDEVYAMAATGNSAVNKEYSWFDEDANTGSNFYRIKVIEKSGMVKYSEVVKVSIAEGKGRITVFPNPVKGSVIQFRLSNLEKGRYFVTLYNYLGQKLHRKLIEHTGRSGTYVIALGSLLSKGTYTLQISKKGTTMNKSVIVQ